MTLNNIRMSNKTRIWNGIRILNNMILNKIRILNNIMIWTKEGWSDGRVEKAA
jgi:hypothetical protein